MLMHGPLIRQLTILYSVGGLQFDNELFLLTIGTKDEVEKRANELDTSNNDMDGETRIVDGKHN